MNYKSFNLGDWIGHISGAIEDERELDGNEMRDLVEFLSTLKREPCEDAISRDKVVDYICDFFKNELCFGGVTISAFIEGLQSFPSVQPKAKGEN